MARVSQIFLLISSLLVVSTVLAQPGDYGENRKSLYHIPKRLVTMPDDLKKSCVTLDNEIVELLPLTYSYVPGFFDDPYNGASIFVGTTNILDLNVTLKVQFPLTYAFLVYYGYEKYKERERQVLVHNRIETLRRAKASKRCFED
jgi:hypothetical protein